MSKNQNHKLRRKSKNAANAENGKGKNPQQEQPKLSKIEEYILNEARDSLASAKANYGSIVSINKEMANLTNQMKGYDNKMANYDKEQIIPRFESLELKVNTLIDLMLEEFEEDSFSKEVMEDLGIEVEPIIEIDVEEEKPKGKVKPKKAKEKQKDDK